MEEIFDNEILLDVIRLNIDSASFHQIVSEVGKDEEKIKAKMLSIVAERGKHHNPITGSGGMLIGTVEKIGSALEGKIDLKAGDKIATLVSLSLTPLRIDAVKKVHLDRDQAEIDGKAILFASGVYAKLPTDMTENLALSVLDVAGAPAQTARLVKKGDSVVIIGANGKSGILCAAVAKEVVGPEGRVIATIRRESARTDVEAIQMVDDIVLVDATDAAGMYEKVHALTNGKMADVVINCVNIENTEMASILACKDRGTVYFFSMATSFTKAALGAEGIGHDVDMIIGNGYAHQHADYSLDVIRRYPLVRKLFEERYA
ncbi:MAG TPA: L-erythro-3,5-diaminohexanoate dehydrogenase [Cyanobacteria bacterium UBA8530]|nr:L-erythro-3,5-diaminohexanoate dehydrogenase [Cyanobacteria bacterium UBA8530]